MASSTEVENSIVIKLKGSSRSVKMPVVNARESKFVAMQLDGMGKRCRCNGDRRGDNDGAAQQ